MQSKHPSEGNGTAPQGRVFAEEDAWRMPLSPEEKAALKKEAMELTDKEERLPALQELRRYRLTKLPGTWTGIARERYGAGRRIVLSDGRCLQVPRDTDVASDITVRLEVSGECITGMAEIRTDFSPLGIEVVDIVTGQCSGIEFDIMDLRMTLKEKAGKRRRIQFNLILCEDGDTLEGGYQYRCPKTRKRRQGIVGFLKVSDVSEGVLHERFALLNGAWEGKGEQRLPEMTIPLKNGQAVHIPEGYMFTYGVQAVLNTRGRYVTGRIRLRMSYQELGVDATDAIPGNFKGEFISDSLIEAVFQNTSGRRPHHKADLKLELSGEGDTLEGIYNAAEGFHTKESVIGHLVLKKISRSDIQPTEVFL
jgi:hypothetical protein